MEYKVIKSRRKTLIITVERDGTILVKAPLRMSDEMIESYCMRNTEWIAAKRREHKRNAACGTPPTDEEIVQLKKQAAQVMGEKTEFYAQKMGVKYKSVKITSAKKRWGSCKKDGSLCYSYRTMLLSDRCRDYVVVHELSHLKQFNHSKEFYREIEKILPEYREAEKELSQFSNYDLYR